MAAPSYTTNLTTLTDAQSGTWAELVGFTGGSAPVVNDTDYFIQDTGCVTQASSKTGTDAGFVFDYGSNVTFAAGDCFFMWHVYLAANAVDTWANGGVRAGAGSGNGDMLFWKTIGSDAGRNPYGGWKNTVIDPTFTADYTIGTPAGTWRWFGSWNNNVSAVSKGNMHAVDAIRYGRGDLVVEFGDGTSGYATVAGMAAANDAQAARWGLMQEQAGSYLWKGLWSLGTATNAVDFRDANRVIVVDDVPRTYASFNRIEIRNTSSLVEWTGYTFLGPVSSPSGSVLSSGEVEVIDNANVNWTTVVFNDLGTFKLLGNTTAVSCTWRRCGVLTQAGATIVDSLFDQCAQTHALLSDDPGLVAGTHFESGGSGHGMRCDTIGTFAWVGNTDNGYTGTRGTNLVSSSGSLDAMFYNNSGGLITLNVGGGAQSPSVRNGAGATTQVNATFVLTLTNLVAGMTVTIVNSATRAELKYELLTGTSTTYSHGGGETVDILLNSTAYDPNLSDVYDLTLPNADSAIKFQLIDDLNYENP